jgi:hypothetical protein
MNIQAAKVAKGRGERSWMADRGLWMLSQRRSWIFIVAGIFQSQSVLGTFCSKFCMANVSANSSTVAVVSNRHAHSLFA